jgi:predicted DNA-binding ribbon-helix-helix protein
MGHLWPVDHDAVLASSRYRRFLFAPVFLRFALHRHNSVANTFRVPAMSHSRGEAVKSSLVWKRSLVIAGHKTSVSLEDQFWDSLKEIASERGMTLSDLVGAIDANRNHTNLSSAIRLFVLGFYRDQNAPRQVHFSDDQRSVK